MTEDEAASSHSNSCLVSHSSQSTSSKVYSTAKLANSLALVSSNPCNSVNNQDLNIDSLQTSAISVFPQNRELPKISPHKDSATGKFLPGNCANPGGRPKSRVISEELRELLAKESEEDQRTGAQKLGEKVFALAEQDKDGYLALAAIKEITDRVEGKATQRVDMRGIVVMMPAQADLEALDSWAGDEE